MVEYRLVGLARGLVLALAIVFGCLLLTGCVSGWGATRAPEPEIEPMFATRTELLLDLRSRNSSLKTLQAEAVMDMVRLDFLVPASDKDAKRREANKSYEKKSWRSEGNGRILLVRDPSGSRNVHLSGDVSGKDFRLVGRDSEFWIVWPEIVRGNGEEIGSADCVYHGEVDRRLVRPGEALSMRPQDISDLLLFDEAVDLRVFSYMETWRDYYILTFLRPDWPQNICSRIWFDRSNLKPAVHQIYDTSGALVAEARFEDYQDVSATGGEGETDLPTKVTLLWPRDMLAVKMALEGVTVNKPVSDEWFKPYRTQSGLPVGHALRELKLEEPKKDAKRAELLLDLQSRMGRLASLQARAVMNITRQDIFVPASVKDDVRRIAGRAYHKKFWRNEVNGYIRLERDPRGSRNISFSGDVSGMDFNFRLLGLDTEFWMAWPNIERDPDDKTEPTGYVYHGRSNRAAARSRETWSMRPQDVSDLLLFDQVFDAREVCYMETWPQFYILTFLREDRPESISSKIWFDRSNMEPAVHQIFDGTGELVAEARFKEYKRFSATKSEVKASLPTMVTLLWPRDMLLMSMVLDGVTVNETIPDRWFKPYRTQADLPVGYELRELRPEHMLKGGPKP